MIDTHYCYRPPVFDAEAFRSLSHDVARLAEAVRSRVRVRGFDGTGSPTITDEKVVLNGDAEAGLEHEPLVIERVFQGRLRKGVGFSFCKTNGKPYDVLVVAVLYALIWRFNDVKFVSDSNEAELEPGFALFHSVLAGDNASLRLFRKPLLDR